MLSIEKFAVYFHTSSGQVPFVTLLAQQRQQLNTTMT
uniref:Uncharacterized protein n=1 Tax=Moniliophthora roreri TaxID=221103 RepID=A0A0W0EUA5_MONRR